MSKKKVKQQFLDKLELFYRNFGSCWTIEELVSNPSQQAYLFEFLVELDKKKIIALKNDGKTFTIIDLPSNHKDLI